MDRRKILKRFGAAALALNLPAVASQSTDTLPIPGAAPEDLDGDALVTAPVVCRVIGVGGAGCNILLAAWSSGLLHDGRSQFACVCMGSTKAVTCANMRRPDFAPIRTVQLGRFGTYGNVNIARAAALKHDRSLRSLVAGADVVILVAGIGGGTGSTVAPVLARMAEESGTLVLGCVVTPHKWELGRYPSAFAAVKELERHSHFLVSMPNEKMGELLGVDATLDEVIAGQEILGTVCIHRLMVDGQSYIERRRRPA